MNNAIEIFESVTGYDLTSYLNNFIDFSSNQQKMIDYYNGDSTQLDNKYFSNLLTLKNQTRDIQSLFIANKTQFTTSDFWDLIELVDSIWMKLDTISNYPKWLRSSSLVAGFSDNIQTDYILKQNQTLESLANEIGYTNPDNDWKELALNNNLKEEDYDFEGGVIFKFSYQNDVRFKLNTVVDVITSDNIYGKDLSFKMQFINDDLLTLASKDTLYQTANILIGLLKGDNPEFPNDGVDKSLISKLNRNFNIFPSLFRQIYTTFSKDDTFKAVSITDIFKDIDSIRMNIRIETRADEIITKTI